MGGYFMSAELTPAKRTLASAGAGSATGTAGTAAGPAMSTYFSAASSDSKEVFTKTSLVAVKIQQIEEQFQSISMSIMTDSDSFFSHFAYFNKKHINQAFGSDYNLLTCAVRFNVSLRFLEPIIKAGADCNSSPNIFFAFTDNKGLQPGGRLSSTNQNVQKALKLLIHQMSFAAIKNADDFLVRSFQAKGETIYNSDNEHILFSKEVLNLIENVKLIINFAHDIMTKNEILNHLPKELVSLVIDYAITETEMNCMQAMKYLNDHFKKKIVGFKEINDIRVMAEFIKKPTQAAIPIKPSPSATSLNPNVKK